MIRRRCPRADGDSDHGPRPSARSERAALRVTERPAGRGASPARVGERRHGDPPSHEYVPACSSRAVNARFFCFTGAREGGSCWTLLVFGFNHGYARLGARAHGAALLLVPFTIILNYTIPGRQRNSRWAQLE